MPRQRGHKTREVRKKDGEVISVVQETLSSIRVVKAFAREEYEEKRLEKETLESIGLTLRARKIKALLSPVVDFIVAGGAWGAARQFRRDTSLSPNRPSILSIISLFYFGTRVAFTLEECCSGKEKLHEIRVPHRDL